MDYGPRRPAPSVLLLDYVRFLTGVLLFRHFILITASDFPPSTSPGFRYDNSSACSVSFSPGLSIAPFFRYFSHSVERFVLLLSLPDMYQ